jgi:beta-1,4-mannosyl-glycoprotein beta-1,4-N-acetylglucosaminyltransferase
MKIVDCFTFYNELDLLEYRLALLDPVVDHFVIAEATITHAGHPKLLYFERNKERFQKYLHKIKHIIVDDCPNPATTLNVQLGGAWINEKHQRNAMDRGFFALGLAPEDVITITDLDEIPNPDTLMKIKDGHINVTIASLEQDMYFYNLTTKLTPKWYHPKVVSIKTYRHIWQPCNVLRFYKCDTIPNGGWHLSYFGDVAFIRNKLKEFAHQECNTEEFTDEATIQDGINNLTYCKKGGNMVRTPLDSNPNLPPLYEKYLQKFIPKSTL